jgi:hypothetical protein
MPIVTKKEFMELGRDVFGEYIEKVPSADRNSFLESFFHELQALDAVFEEEEESPKHSLKDLNRDDGILYQEWIDDEDV